MKCEYCPCENINKECIYENVPYVCDLIKKQDRLDLKELALKECMYGDGVQKIVREPHLAQKAVNFTSSLFNHLLTGMQIVTPEVQADRIKICESCEEYFDVEKRICKHIKCGCPIDKKTSWQSEECPIGKWGSIDTLGSGCGCSG